MDDQTPRLQKTELIITPQTFVKTVLLIVGTVLVLTVLRLTAHALFILFIAFFFALALNAPVSFIARHIPGRARGSRAWATSIGFIVVILAIGIFIGSFVPPLTRQTQNLVDAAPGLIEDVRTQRGAAGQFIAHYNLDGPINSLSEEITSRVKNGNGAGTAFSTVQSVGTSLVTLLTVLVLTFMMLVEGPRRVRLVHELIPQQHKVLASRIVKNMYKVVKGFVNGQVVLAAIAALLITPALFALDISYPIGLAVIVFICGLIPLVGHTIGAVIVTIIALFTSPSAAIIILAYYILYQQIENYLIQPRIQANSTDMSPLLIFGSVVVGTSFGGLLGGLLAIPVAGCIRILVLEYFRSKGLIKGPMAKHEIKEATGTAK